MGIFDGKQGSKPGKDIDDVIQELEKAILKLERAVLEHDVSLSELEHVSIEWADWFEKFKNLYARLNKRVQREEEKQAAAPEEAPISPQAQRILGSRR